MTDTPPPVAYAIGSILSLIVLLKLADGVGLHGASLGADALTVLVLALLAPQVRGSRHVFLAVSAALTVLCLATAPEPGAILKPALDQASFIIAFFCALASLQHVAGRSPAIGRAAAFLANQPSGRRYLALAGGVQVFALMLNYGALSLLGTMSKRAADREPEPHVRALRTRRMLQGAQCGFGASLSWSPLAFAVVITSSIVPGAELRSVVAHGLVSAAIIVTAGWLLDRRLKRLLPAGTVVAPPDPTAARDTRSLLPLAALLAAVAIPALLLDIFAGIAPSRSVLGLVPLIAAIWVMTEAPAASRRTELAARSRAFVFGDLPSFQAELVLLSTAGFIGSAAGALAANWIAAAGIDLTAIPVRVLLLMPLVLVPLAGQVGLNPILFVSLAAQLLPSPEALGIAPIALVIALTAGWSLTAPTSPFTASVMIISRISGAPVSEVTWRWNGAFVVAAAAGLAVWIQLLA